MAKIKNEISGENTEYDKLIDELDEKLYELCKERGLTGDEMFIIAAATSTPEVVERFSEEGAIRLAIETIKMCKNSDDIFHNVLIVLGINTK